MTTATKELTEITVPIKLSQLEEIHEVWRQFCSVLDISESNSGSASMSIVLRPLADRMSAVVVEEWESMMDKAKNGGAA